MAQWDGLLTYLLSQKFRNGTMTIQEITQTISTLRAVCAQYELVKHPQTLDAVSSFLEAPIPIVSVVGARTAGKCAIVNSLAGADILPSKIFKPHVLYRVYNGHGQSKVRLVSGEEAPLHSLEDVGRFSKRDFDATVLVEANTGLFQNIKTEVRTGFDVEDNCPLLACVLSDVVLYCVKATALFSLEDVAFIDGLLKMGHRNVLICVTHINNVSQKGIPEIVKFVASKHLNYPVAYFSDEPVADIHQAIRDDFGTNHIQQTVMRYLSEGVNYSLRTSVAKNMLGDVIEDMVRNLSEKKVKQEQLKDRKYSTYLAKMSKYESMRLGWTDIRFEYEKRETKCVETILAELSKAKGKVASRLQASVASVASPKDWWENVFPLTLNNEIDSLTSGIDNMLQSTIIRDFNWLNHELQVRYHQTAQSDNISVGETTLDFTLDPNSLTLSNLRMARYISMAGGASLATALFITVGPVGALASATCSILGDRIINKTISEQRVSLKNVVANVIDDVFTRMESMIPARVNGLYEEMAKGIAEKEQAWSSSNPVEEFTCEEIQTIDKLNKVINDIENLK